MSVLESITKTSSKSMMQLSKCDYSEQETVNLSMYGNSDDKKWACVIINRWYKIGLYQN